MRNIQRTIAVLPFALLAVALIAAGVSAVNAQESDDAPPGVSVRQSDTATSTPIAIGPPHHVAGRAAATAPDTPARPRRLEDADITTTSIRISWAAPSDNGSPITGYTVRYQDRDGGGHGEAGPWSEVSASASSTSRVVSGLSPATRYNFEVKAANGVGDSDWSPNRYGHTKPGRVSTPSLTAGNGSLDVIWSAPSGGTAIESYQVQHRPTSESTWTTAGSSTTSPFTITGLTNGSPYHVQVRACNRMLFVGGAGHNCGAWSRSATGTPQTVAPPAPVPPPADRPGAVTLSTSSPQVEAEVTATLTDQDGIITNESWRWQSSSDGSSWSNISGATGRSYTPGSGDVGLRLRATVTYDDAHGTGKSATSAATSAVSAAPPPPPIGTKPGMPLNLTGATGSNRGEIDLDWEPASGATSYKVEEWQQSLIPGVYRYVRLSDSEVTIDVSAASAVVNGRVGGRTYRHRVIGLNANNQEGPPSDHVDTTLTLPDKVAGLLGVPGPGHGEITLTWQAANLATGYQVLQKKPRRLQPDQWIVLPAEGFVVEINGTTAVVRKSDPELDPGESHEHRVRAVGVHGEGPWSDSVGTALHDETPDAPEGVSSANMVGNRGVFLIWRPVAEAGGYGVDVSPTNSLQETTISTWTAKIIGLAPGTTYTFRVRAWEPHGNSRLYSPWSEAVHRKAPTPKHWWGHQADHNVKYVKGTIGNSVIEGAITRARSEWNLKMRPLGKSLEICTSCDDDFMVTIKTVDNNNGATTLNNDPEQGCGWSYACVKRVGAGGENRSAAPGRHMENIYMIFEDPPKSAEEDGQGGWDHITWVWTKDEGKSGKPVACTATPAVCATMPTRLYAYIDRVMKHEFGHTLGLPDYYDNRRPIMDFLDAVMNIGNDITDEDTEQLRAIYQRHSAH